MPLYPNDRIRCVEGVYIFLRKERNYSNGGKDSRVCYVFVDEEGVEFVLRSDEFRRFFGVQDERGNSNH